MSWSVNAKGTPSEVRAQIERGFAQPLAPKPDGLADDGERETVARVRDTIRQCLETFESKKIVVVNSYGHMGGGYQNVHLTIDPAPGK